MNRSEAFGKVINQRGVHHKLGYSDGYIRSLRKKYNDGDHVTDDQMKEILTRYGAKLKQEEVWEV